MGFNIVVLGASGSFVEKRLFSRVSDLPWVLNRANELFGADSGDMCLHFSGRSRPSIVVSLAAGDGQDYDTLSKLKNLLPYCAQARVPVIHLSSFHALGGLDPTGVYPDTTLVQKSDDEGLNIYAEFERLVGTLEKHVILRRSWILDASVGSMLSEFVPKILAGEDFSVSDLNYGSPVSSVFLADAIVAIIQQVLTGAENWGLYHVQSSDICSEAEFCDYLVRQLTKVKEIDFRGPQVVPHESAARYFSGAANLSGRKLTDDFGIQPLSWKKGFGSMLKNWLKREQ